MENFTRFFKSDSCHFYLGLAALAVLLNGCSAHCNCPRPETVVTPPASSTTVVTPDDHDDDY